MRPIRLDEEEWDDDTDETDEEEFGDDDWDGE